MTYSLSELYEIRRELYPDEREQWDEHATEWLVEDEMEHDEFVAGLNGLLDDLLDTRAEEKGLR